MYIVLGLFVFPKSDPYSNVALTINNAIQSPGDPNCSSLNLSKDQSINTTVLLNKEQLSNLKLFVWFETTNPKYTVFKTKDYSSFNPNQNVKELYFCSICYPGIIFNQNSNMSDVLQGHDLFCEVVFGTKFMPLEYNFDVFNKTEDQGFKEILVSKLPDGYYLSYFVLNNENRELINKDNLAYLELSPDKQIDFSKFFSSKEFGLKNQIELSKAGDKIILQAILPGNLNPFSGIILPAKFSIDSINVLPNDKYQSKECKPTTIDKQYIDMDKQMCLVYNNCEGCGVIAEYCANAWKNSGIIVEPVSPEYAISYTTLDNTCP